MDVYVKGISSVFGTYMPIHPNKVMIDLVSTCNYNCVWCMRHHIKFKNKKMPKDFALHILQEIKAKKIEFTAAGEPLMYPLSDLIDLIEITQIKDKRITTNGYLLQGNIAKGLGGSSISKIKISINTPESKEYSYITGGGDLHVVEQNIKNFVKEYSTPIAITAVTTKETVQSLLKMPEYASSLGASEMNFQNLHVWYEGYHRYHPLSDGMIDTFRNEILDRCNQYGIKTNIMNLHDGVVKNFCNSMFTEFNINVDGYLLPCCKELAQPICKVSTFSDTWNSKPVREFRQKMLSGDFPPFCRKLCHIGGGNY